MEVIQSWGYPIIILALTLSNILFVKTLKREIKSIKSRNEELERTNKASLELSDGSIKQFTMYKEIVNVDELMAHFGWKVEAKVNEEIEHIKKEVLNPEILAKLMANDVNKQLAEYCLDNLRFVVYVMINNNTSEEGIKRTVAKFFPRSPWVEKMIKDEIQRFNEREPNPDVKSIETQKNL